MTDSDSGRAESDYRQLVDAAYGSRVAAVAGQNQNASGPRNYQVPTGEPPIKWRLRRQKGVQFVLELLTRFNAKVGGCLANFNRRLYSNWRH